MKLSLLIIFSLISVSLAAAPACVKASYCMGCSMTAGSETKCTSCFNYANKTVMAKAFASDSCAANAVQISGCKYQVPAANGVVASTDTDTGCYMCEDSSFGVTVNTSAATPAVVTNVCAALPTGCTEISNCATQVCKTAAGTHTASATNNFCKVCAKGYAHTSTTVCGATPIANCDYTMWNAGSNPAAANCYIPKSGYVVVKTRLSTVAWTGVENCKGLHSGDAMCELCWDGYYWDTTKCSLASNLLGLGFLAAVALFFN